MGEAPPRRSAPLVDRLEIPYWVTETGRTPTAPAAGFNAVDFAPDSASGFRLVGTNQNPVNFGVYIGLTEPELFGPSSG